MDSRQVIERIERLRVLEDLPSPLRSDVAAIFERISALRSVPAGGLWIREHDKAENKGFILLQGTAIVRKTGSPDLEIEAPELLGETMQFTETQERTATVTATSDCAVMRFMWDDFWREVESTFDPVDQERIRSAVSELAWRHLAQ